MPDLYDRLSGWYDGLSASEHPLVDAGLRRLAVRPGERVVEIGSGPGYALAALAGAARPGGAVWGVDRSAGMLGAARARLRRAGCEAGLIRGDALWLPFAPGSLDALFLSFTLELFEDRDLPRVLGECRRVLARAGRLGVVALLQVPRPNRMSRAYAWCHARFPRLVDCHPIDAPAWLERAGFQVTARDEFSLWGLPVALVMACPAGNPV